VSLWKRIRDQEFDVPPDFGRVRGLRGLAALYCDQSWEYMRMANRLGRRHRSVHFSIGIAAALFAAVAGTAGIAEWSPIVTGIAGFAASALALMATRLDAERLARFHFTQGADYGAISRLFQGLVKSPAEPTRKQLDDLVERLRVVQARKLDEQDRPATPAE
jgi:hypothetical protein